MGLHRQDTGVGFDPGRKEDPRLRPSRVHAVIVIPSIHRHDRDLPQRPRLGQLAKEHGGQLRPTTETASVTLGLELTHMTGKIRALKKGKNLGKQTRGVRHFDLR